MGLIQSCKDCKSALGVLRRYAPADYEPADQPSAGIAPGPVEAASQRQTEHDPGSQGLRNIFRYHLVKENRQQFSLIATYYSI
jgi:hypothetical protein